MRGNELSICVVSVVGCSVVKCIEELQYSDGLSNKLCNIIRRHIDNMMSLLISSLLL
jgi:hypothetical protein